MLKISEKTNLAIFFLLTLAEGKSASVADVAKKWTFVSPGYLEEVVAALRKGGLVVGRKGRGGGYMLARPADTMTVLDIVRAIDGPLALVETSMHTKMRNTTEGPSVSLDRRSFCTPFEGWCVSRRLWGRVQQGVETALKEITLADLVRDGAQFQPQPRTSPQPSPMRRGREE